MVRKMTQADREDFLRLSEIFYASPAVMHSIPFAYHERAFEELMRSDEYGEGYILEKDGKAVGFGLTAKTYSREAGGKVLWLEELFVLPEFRSCGLGREFFAMAEAQAIKEGFARIRLEVEEENGRARSLYERLGYKTLGYRQMYKELNV